MRAGAAQRSKEAVHRAILTPPVEIRRHPTKGRALHAARLIARGELIEAAPVIVFGPEDCALLDRTIVGHYYFHWDGEETSGRGALPLGLLTLCNHAPSPNARVHRNFADMTLELVALEEIAPGTEITIDYGCELWFEPA
jgi:SET domain-containing protein